MLSAVEQVLSVYEFQLRRALPGRLLGEHIQAQPGDGYETRDTRPYETGDTWRDVDHRESARMGEWYVREMYADREVDIWLLLDVRRAMRLGAKASKYSHALHLLLAAFAWSGGTASRLGAIRLGADVSAGLTDVVRPALQGRPMAMETLDWLRKSPIPEAGSHRTLPNSLKEAAGHIERDSVVYIASDMSSLDVIPFLRPLSYRHELTLFSVRDDVDDLTMQVSGWNNLQDADSGRQSSGYISRRKREKEAKKKADEIVNFDDKLSGLPLSHVKVSTADNPFDNFVKFARNYQFERRHSA